MAHNDEKAGTTGPAASHQPGWVNQWTIYALGGATAIALILAVTGWSNANSYQEQANGLRAEVNALKGQASDLQGQVAALQGQVKDAQGQAAAANGEREALRPQLASLEQEIAELEAGGTDDARLAELRGELERQMRRSKVIPYLDPVDVRYNRFERVPRPVAQAVMFCLMDVSGSMTQSTKDIAKRFFILLYLFLKRNYDKIDVVFIRHHTSAKEVDEEEFFYSRETGGTIVSSALKMMQEIMAERYPANEWNIYAAQASDGDNWNDDSPLCRDILINQIMPFVQYFTYVEITPREHQALWYEYNQVAEAFSDAFAQQQLVSAADIYPVFRELFQRRMTS